MANPPGAIWQVDSYGVRNLTFIPEGVLQAVGLENLESLTLPPRSASQIRDKVNRARQRAASGQNPCTLGVMGALPAGVPNPSPQGLEALRAAQNVVVGVVERLVSGLLADGEAGTSVQIRVTRVVKTGTRVEIGEHLTLLEHIGRTHVAGVEICTDKPDYRLPHLGDEVVIGGDPDPANRGHFSGGGEYGLFFVHNGLVELGVFEPEKRASVRVDELAGLVGEGSR
jgi:hypothetical protein